MSEDVKDFIRQHNTGVLCTADSNGVPWGSVVYYASDESGDVFFMTHSETRKFKNILVNPKVAFIIFNKDKLQTMQISGTASTVDDPQAEKVWSDKIKSITSRVGVSDTPAASMNAGEYVLIKVSYEQSKFSDYKS